MSTDSGWNCTPSTGRVRCLIAMMTPDAVRPVTSQSAGTVDGVHRQRVVARRGEGVRQPGEDAHPLVLDEAGLAVQQLGRPANRRPVGHGHGLQPEADAEDRHTSGELAHQGDADPGVLGNPRAGAQQHTVEAR